MQRINKFIAQANGLSRREADRLIKEGRVSLNGDVADTGLSVEPDDVVRVDGDIVEPQTKTTIMLNKPSGYIVSRAQQGKTPTIYSLLPENLWSLKYIGRLDKDSRGLLLLTNDGDLMQKLTHPSYQKAKVYEAKLDQPLTANDKRHIEAGVNIDNEYTSRFELTEIRNSKFGISNRAWRITMREGRNRQIRRTFEALGYEVTDLLRTEFGEYSLGDLKDGEYKKSRKYD